MGVGGIGESLTYQQSTNFMFNTIAGGLFVFDPLGNFSFGSGFESALFQISLNGAIFESQTFADLAAAQAFFNLNNLIDISLAAGLNNIELAFIETMSTGQGFGFGYSAAAVSYAPLPPSWSFMLMGLCALAAFFYRQHKHSLGASRP